MIKYYTFFETFSLFQEFAVTEADGAVGLWQVLVRRRVAPEDVHTEPGSRQGLLCQGSAAVGPGQVRARGDV